MELDDRKRTVLAAVITDYIATAEPVGSRTIARRYGLGVSPATIRNEMSDLVEMGYLEQPHTSAGRVPSDRGYRFFVDCLMAEDRPDQDQVERIRLMLTRRARRVEATIKRAIQVLAETTDCLAIIMGPEYEESVLQYLQLLPLKDGRAILVLATDTGLLHSRVVEWSVDLSEDEAARISSVLSHRLRGLTIDRVGRDIIGGLADELHGYRSLVDHVLDLLSSLTRDPASERVFVGGTTRILRQPEFHDIGRVQALLEALERQEFLQQLLSAGMDVETVQVIIGRENPLQPMQDCSVVMATYFPDQLARGRIAVLGPRRMDYARVVGLVNLMRSILNEALRPF